MNPRPNLATLWLRLACALLLCATQVCIPAMAQDAGEDVDPDAARAIEALRNLESDDFQTRQAALMELWGLGNSARKALVELQRTGDAESKMRARIILDRLRYGITPETPPEVVEELYRFRSASFAEKRQILVRLSEEGRTEIVMRLVKNEPDPKMRTEFASVLSQKIEVLIPELIAKKDYAGAQQLLEMLAFATEGMRELAVFHHLNGTLDEAIETQRGKAKNSQADGELLVWFLRAKGDIAEAVKVAEEIPNERLAKVLNIKDAASFMEVLPRFDEDEPIKRLLRDAVVSRDKGDAAELKRIVGDIRKMGGEDDELARVASDILLALGYPDEAIGLSQNWLHRDFKILTQQGRYAEAFKLLGIDDPRPPYDAWVKEQCDVIANAGEGNDAPLADIRFRRLVAVAAFCASMGEKEQAENIFKATKKATTAFANGREDPFLLFAIRHSADAGLLDYAMAEAERAIDLEASPLVVLSYVFPGASEAVSAWLKILDPLPSASVIRRLFETSKPGTPEREEVIDILDLAEQKIRGRADEEMLSTGLRAYVQAARAHGLEERIEPFFKRVSVNPNKNVYLQWGIYHSEGERWSDALVAFQQARKLGIDDSSIYLHEAYAQEKAGDKTRAEDLRKIGRFAGLGNPQERLEIATQLFEQGKSEEAAAAAELIVRLSEPVEIFGAGGRAQRIVQAARPDGDSLAMAASRERSLLGAIASGLSYSQVSSYLTLPNAIAEQRATAYLKNGDKAAALAQIAQAQRTLPNNSSLLENFYDELVIAGDKESADRIFEGIYKVSKACVDLFPESPYLNNNLAWLLARCHRNLDEALTHAEKANALLPDSAAYIDTLAEVKFQMGNREEAIKLSERAVELLPGDMQLEEQLEHFKNDTPGLPKVKAGE